MKKPPALSIICISAMICSAPLHAQDGCYQRHFDGAYLEAHPEHVVERLTLYVLPGGTEAGGRSVQIWADMAGQGHALRRGAAGLTLEEFALCDADGQCGIICGGGSFVLAAPSDESLTIATVDARVSGQSCTPGTVTSPMVSRPGEAETFTLSAVDDSACGL